jgi:hypothetical protein
MLFAGAIELSTADVALILAVLAAAAMTLLAIGALTAWVISRRPAAIPLGALALAVVMVLVGDATQMAHVGFLAGWAASAGVGFLLPTRPRSPVTTARTAHRRQS